MRELVGAARFKLGFCLQPALRALQNKSSPGRTLLCVVSTLPIALSEARSWCAFAPVYGGYNTDVAVVVTQVLLM